MHLAASILLWPVLHLCNSMAMAMASPGRAADMAVLSLAGADDLFGGSRSWQFESWTASDDRVRGGRSQSFLEAVTNPKNSNNDAFSNGEDAHFHGTLDIKTLGGAGFASQRTTAEDRTWDLSGYHGIQLCIAASDGKRYTLILKDSLPARRSRPDGRDEAGVGWEYDFVATNTTTTTTTDNLHAGREEDREVIKVPWSAFKPTYRGREDGDAAPLRTADIRRFAIMMRSFFGGQEGPFSMRLHSISAYRD